MGAFRVPSDLSTQERSNLCAQVLLLLNPTQSLKFFLQPIHFTLELKLQRSRVILVKPVRGTYLHLLTDNRDLRLEVFHTGLYSNKQCRVYSSQFQPDRRQLANSPDKKCSCDGHADGRKQTSHQLEKGAFRKALHVPPVICHIKIPL